MSKLIKRIIAGGISAISLTFTAFYLLTMDFSKYPYDFDNSEPDSSLIEAKSFFAFKDIKTNPNIEIKINQNDLNELFYKANKKVRENNPTNLEQFYVEIKDNRYAFYVEANYRIFRTRIAINTTLTSNDEEFVFNIQSIKTGLLNTWGILNSLGKIEQIHLQDIFKEAGLSINVDLANDRFIYSKENLKSDLLKLYKNEDLLMGTIESSNPNYLVNNGLEFSASLESLQSNNQISDSRDESNHYYMYTANQLIIDNANQIVTNGLASGRSEELIKGDFKSEISKLRKDYSLDNEPLKFIQDKILEHPASTYGGSSVNAEVAYIDEYALDKYLNTSSSLGKFNLLPIGKNHLFAVIDNVYCDLYTTSNNEAYMNFTFAIDINGLKTRAIVETKYQSIPNSYKADFKITNVYYGANIIDNEFSDSLVDMLDATFNEHQAINEDARYYSFNKENKTIRFDFDKLLNIESSLSDYKDVLYGSDGTRSLIVNLNGVNENGKLIFKFVK